MYSWCSLSEGTFSSMGIRQLIGKGLAVIGFVALAIAVSAPCADAQVLYALTYALGGPQTVSKISATGVVSSIALQDGGVGFGSSLVVDKSGNFYVSYDDNIVRKFDSTGNSLPFTLSGGSLDLPIDLAIDASGNLYAANLNNNSISKITPTGFVSTFAMGDQLDFPWQLAFDASGNLYSASLDTPSISRFDGLGNALPFPALSGGGLIDFNPLGGLAFDALGNLYATNSNLGTIVKIDNTGNATVFATATDSLQSLTVDNAGNFYTIGLNDHQISKFDSAGNPIAFTLSGDSLNIPLDVVFVPAAVSAPEPTACLLLITGMLPFVGRRLHYSNERK